MTRAAAGSGADAPDAVIAQLTLQHAIGSLSSAHRAVLVELHGKGHSVDEAARRLDIPVGTVKSRAHYALRFLRDALQVDGRRVPTVQ